MEKPVIKIGLLGLGTVGSGVLQILRQNGDEIEKKICRRLEVTKILVRDPAKARDVYVDPGLLTADVNEILDDPTIEIVVEVMGGLETARDHIIAALNRGKNVVTANKDVLAVYGKELFDAAQQHQRDLNFEASVAGGIPIIRPLKECLAGNRLQEVMGIINGTTNYILTKMSLEGSDFAAALQEAQALGYAEADPAADVEGYDAARKISILASIAFNTRVTLNDVYVEGITKITPDDIEYARELGYVVKLLGIARESEGQVEVRVHPVMISVSHPLAQVNNVFNAIFIKGDAVGEAMFYGRGAGSLPTGSAVVGDIIEISRNISNNNNGRVSCTCYDQKPLRPMGEVKNKYFLRLLVKDRPGVMASITGVFGNQNVSLASVIQKSSTDSGMAEIVLVTHQVMEQYIQDALAIVGGMSIVGEVCSVIRVEDSDFRWRKR